MRNTTIDHGQNFVLILLLVIENIASTIDDLKHVSDIIVYLKLWNFNLDKSFVQLFVFLYNFKCLNAYFSLFHGEEISNTVNLTLQWTKDLRIWILIDFHLFQLRSMSKKFCIKEFIYVFFINFIKFMLLRLVLYLAEATNSFSQL
jgi:hypothetical protein